MEEKVTYKKWNDQRDETFGKRMDIGFGELKERWRKAEAVYTDDTLKICGHPVMESWEHEYMKELARIATMNGGKVLEVGFGMGISAAYVQEHEIDEHLIIEANTEVVKKAEAFARSAKRPARILAGFWEEVVADIPNGSLSGILFDTYPLVPEEVHRNHFPFFQEAQRMLRPGGVLTYYSDEISQFSPLHMQCLRAAGFRKISGKVCDVLPPEDCEYWTAKTILAPIIIK